MSSKPEALRLPLLPLRDQVLLPGAVIPLVVGRRSSMDAINRVSDHPELTLAVFAQRDAMVTKPGPDDLHLMGCSARIHHRERQPDGTTRILVEGLGRLRLLEPDEDGIHVTVLPVEEPKVVEDLVDLRGRVTAYFEDLSRHDPRIDSEATQLITELEDAPTGRVADAIASLMPLSPAMLQALLNEADPIARMQELLEIVRRELANSRTNGRLRSQRDISEVLEGASQKTSNGRSRAREMALADDDDDEIESYLQRIDSTKLPTEAREAALKEVSRLAKMPPMSPESSVIRGYLDTMLSLPWEIRSEDRLDARRAQRQLDADHFGLEKVKERILEFLSVVKLSGNLQGSILCLVGPPGVGKTSLGRSIAAAMDRKFVRVSLGGVHDESEIRGHRRTYIGSKHGRILEGLRRSGVRNPVFLLDEIDKLGRDFRGDPSAALLEVLDPEQNSTYSDHFIEVPFDLSEVFFVCTANDMHQIPAALEDRMEILRLPGYLKSEKVAIAREFLLPRVRERNGLARTRFSVSEAALHDIVQLYTRESGVRELERQLSRICRKIARAKAERRKVPRSIQRSNLQRFLGAPKYLQRMVEEHPELGVVTGLAWTPVGGEILEIEAMLTPGKGKLVLTGNLQDVMKESAQIALSYARNAAPEASKILESHDVHIHVPEGAVPKDGPSAGVAMAVAITSLLTGRKVRRDVAMTGELTLRGKVLPIGGLPEKSVAAQTAGCGTILIPEDNRKDFDELPRELKRGLKWHRIRRVEEALELALLPVGTKEDPLVSKEADHPSAERPN